MLLAPVDCSAKDVKLGPTSITLTGPPNFCELDETSPRFKVARELLSNRNLQLAIYADCKSDTKYWLNNFATYVAPTHLINAKIPENAIILFCAELRKKGDERFKEIIENRQSDIEQALGGLKINEARFLGVLGEAPTVCYSGLLQGFASDNGTQRTVLGISATVLVKGRIINYNLYTLFENGGTLQTLLATHRSNVSALMLANQN
jgi:hypothetical protein